jgi:hypothetical protein
MTTAKRLVSFIALAHLALACASVGAEEGFVTVFNGKDLSGWKMGPDKSWVVEDGVIALQRANFDSKEHNLDYLWLDRPLGNFIVELEFKTGARANSGVYVRTADPKDPVPTGIEVQVVNSYGQTTPHCRSTAAAIYDCLAPSTNAVKAPGEWNHYRITCRDNKIVVVLNGTQVVDMDLDKWNEPNKNPDGTQNKFNTALKNFARKGYFGFQDHGVPVWYRSIRLKTLD